jgi:hypothetical protein
MHYWTEEEIDRVASMMKEGMSTTQIGAALGYSRNAITGIVGRTHRLKRIGFARRGPTPRNVAPINLTRSQIRQREDERAMSEAKQAAGIRYLGPRTSIEDIEARLAEIPADTRSLTARLFGDPLPERSALFQRAQGRTLRPARG